MLLSLNLTYSQLASWELDADGSPNGVNANIFAGDFTGGSGIGSISFGSKGATANHWTKDNSANPDDYFQVTLTPNSGYTINITDINFGERRSGAGIRHYQVAYSLASDFSNNTVITTVDVPDNKSERIGDISGLDIDVPNGSTIYIRWFVYEAEQNGGT